jgi:hypothetical protein
MVLPAWIFDSLLFMKKAMELKAAPADTNFLLPAQITVYEAL